MKNPIRVLYVDDDKGLLDIGKKFLERTGDFSVTTLESATLALDLLKKDRFDAIISDYQMPGMDGIRFLEEVRAQFGKIPFIIFTGRGREEIVIQALNAGADFYLQKGGSLEAQFAELSHKVQIAVENFRSREKIQSLNRLYSVLSATNKAIVFLRERDEFFSEICRILVEIGGFRMAWIGLADTEHHLIRPVAAAGHINGYLDNVRISTADVPRGRGPTGRAYREGKYYFSNNIARDPLMEPWRENALKQGYLANAAFPFSLGTKNAGVISVYAPVTGFFDDQVIELLEELSIDVSFALRTLDDQNAHKTADTALYNSENRYRSLVDGLHDCVAVYAAVDDGQDFVILEFNQSAERTEQVTREEAVGHRLTEIFPGVKEFGILDVLRRVFMTGTPESFPVAFYTDNRISGWRDNFVYRLPSGEIVASYCDETARKKTEEALQKSEEQFRSLVETTGTGYVILDIEGRVITANQEYLRLTGRTTMADITGRPVTDWTAPYDLEKNAREVRECIRNGLVRALEIDYQKPDGQIQPIEINASVLQSDGQQKIILTLCRDITERKRAEGALRKSEEKFRNLFDWANDGILLHTLTTGQEAGRFLDANPVACRLLGYTPEEMLALGPPDIVPADFHPLLADIIRQAERKESVLFQTRLLRKDGTTFPAESSGHLVVYEGKKIWLSHIRDLSESQRLEEALEKNEKLLRLISDNLSSGVIMVDAESHEIELINPSAARLFGKKTNEIVGKKCHMFLCPEEEGTCPITDLRQEIDEAERVVLSADGTKIPVLKSVKRIWIDNREKLLENFIDIREFKRAEKDLKESELRFRSLIQNSSDLINILDTEGRIIYDSPATRRILGYPEGFFIGRQALDFIHPDDLETVRNNMNEVLERSNTGIPTEFRLRKADGDYIDVEAVAVNLIGVAGVNGIVITAHPITERKRDEHALRQSEEKYRDLYDNAPNAYYSIGTDGRIIRCNKEAGRILGIPHEDLVGMKISEFYADTPDGREKAIKLIAGFRDGKILSNEELRMKRADGTLIWIQLTVNAVSDSRGQIIESRTTIVDITERKSAEDALRTNEHRLATIYDTVSDVIFYLSIEPGGVYRFSSANPAFSRVTGLPADAIVDKRVDEVIPEPSLAMVIGKYRQAIEEKTIIRWEETTDYPAGRLSGEVSIAPICDDAGVCTHLVGSVHNITDRKRAEDAIRQANRQLNLMTSITRHDINNKISVITGYLTLAKKKFPDPTLGNYFGKMESAIKAIQTQIEFTRVYHDLGTREPQWEELDNVLPKSHVPPGVLLNADIAGIEVYADPMLEKVFFNLLDNSIRHGQHVTEIRVSSCQSPEGLMILWEDNGIGIVSVEKELIFERGFGKNTGLGMFLAREILSLTGISIRETGTEGQGARFEIIVPPGKFRQT
jgi:PAS domain S-box-containing protein